ncbi:hypothetical protein BAUCODRAFT_93624 [Baudoinia panamericana UAMH 10762]|uniref:AB hydrolase-1 domain-containing protein n=1 Tax=Baudoinia panamericana (strain UAMH 10762) TaxID=717646 RepID=M2MBB3_BAUPA|nr:uncharacterized protein BAUCODRAFT_93624 [Baudoinia panamericana UAMH 10762]EMC93786.1 hypothetical protein BAUCODRAFT_93624 [Baudoinia panamericana UAMH 10762]
MSTFPLGNMSMEYEGYPSPSSSGRIRFDVGRDKPFETAYFVYGDLTSKIPPLVCLHGGPGATCRYLAPLSVLQERYHIPVVMYDQIGCGQSTHLPETRGDTSFWTVDLFVDELRNLLFHLDITEYHLMGHSWGGLPMITFALTKPTGLRSLIAYSTPASFPLRIECCKRQYSDMGPEMGALLMHAHKDGKSNTAEFKDAMNKFNRKHMCRLEVPPQPYLDVYPELARDDTVAMTLFGADLINMTGSLKNWDVTPDLCKITPTTAPGGILVMNGWYDTTQDDATAAYFIKPSARVKWVQFAESSHMAHMEEPERFTKTLGEFLQMA